MKKICDKCDRMATHHSVEVVGGDDIAQSEVALAAGNLGTNPVGLASEAELVGSFRLVIKDTIGEAEGGCAKIARGVAAQGAWMTGHGSFQGGGDGRIGRL